LGPANALQVVTDVFLRPDEPVVVDVFFRPEEPVVVDPKGLLLTLDFDVDKKEDVDDDGVDVFRAPFWALE
jgi:hypothetical protein